MAQPNTLPTHLVWWRVTLAFALATGVAALAYACILPFTVFPSYADGVWRSFPFVAIVGAYPPTLLLALPAFLLLLHRRLRLRLVTCVAAGALTVVLPFLVIALMPDPGGVTEASGGRATIVDGSPT